MGGAAVYARGLFLCRSTTPAKSVGFQGGENSLQEQCVVTEQICSRLFRLESFYSGRKAAS